MTHKADTSALPLAIALALSSTISHNAGRSDFARPASYQSNVSRTAKFDLAAFSYLSASTEPRALTLTEAAESLKQVLAKEGITTSRVEQTIDRSILFQFLGQTKACIDLYPNGDLIVVTRRPGRDEIHELQYGDSDRAIKLLQDAGINS